MDSDISPSLPSDLEREIFEMAANRYPETIPALLLVAQRVLQWIEPLLYRTLVFIDHESPWDPAAFCPESAKLAKYVQNMLISVAPPRVDFALRVLSFCSGIRKLTLFGSYPTMLPALDKMQLRQLSVDLLELFGIPAIDPARPLFGALTHLRLLNSAPELNFGELPALTHLCLPDRSSLGLISSTLANCSRLRVLVTMFRTRSGLRRYSNLDLSTDDPRLVLMPLSFEEQCVEDWKLSATGGRDIWLHAENFVARRRRGEIQPASRCWIEDSDVID
ncbi:hypothetical protein C8J57DRAFT_1345280 [Mycena rebaudengoi]|nr:hypothetical protein C8J57DRAFT_1345280 [Mycena rebaudengoi]